MKRRTLSIFLVVDLVIIILIFFIIFRHHITNESKSEKEGANAENVQIFQDFIQDKIKCSGRLYSEQIDIEWLDTNQVENYLFDVDEDGEDELLVFYDLSHGYAIYDNRDGLIWLLSKYSPLNMNCKIYRRNGHIFIGYDNRGTMNSGHVSQEFVRYSSGEIIESNYMLEELFHMDGPEYYIDEKIVTEQEYKDYLDQFVEVMTDEFIVLK